MPENSIDIAVVGAGPTGLMAAIALAASGVPVTMIAPPARADHRTTALLASSVTALDTVGVWRTCEAQAAPLRVMRLIDDTGRLLRAPEARFDAREIGLEAFGYNIENNILVAALNARAAELPALRRIDEEADAISCEDDAVRITLRSGKVVGARLIVGADGHRSLCRSAAGIGTNLQDYRQVALTYNVVHERGHQGISTEFHTATGPFTLVPLPGNRSSIVCVVDAAQADRLDGMDAPALARELERRAHSILGKINVETDRGRFPLATEIADRFASRRIALVGEAVHRLPPIGAQGLNLGLRDAAGLAELVVSAHRADTDPGATDLLERYERTRQSDLASRAIAVDLLNRTLLSGFFPFQGARAAALHVLNRFGPLRRAAMREGIAPRLLPRLMNGETLN